MNPVIFIVMSSCHIPVISTLVCKQSILPSFLDFLCYSRFILFCSLLACFAFFFRCSISFVSVCFGSFCFALPCFVFVCCLPSCCALFCSSQPWRLIPSRLLITSGRQCFLIPLLCLPFLFISYVSFLLTVFLLFLQYSQCPLLFRMLVSPVSLFRSLHLVFFLWVCFALCGCISFRFHLFCFSVAFCSYNILSVSLFLVPCFVFFFVCFLSGSSTFACAVSSVFFVHLLLLCPRGHHHLPLFLFLLLFRLNNCSH